MTKFVYPRRWKTDHVRTYLISRVGSELNADAIFWKILDLQVAAEADGVTTLDEASLRLALGDLFFEDAMAAILIGRDESGKLTYRYEIAHKEAKARPEKPTTGPLPAERMARLEAIYRIYPKRLTGQMAKRAGMNKALEKFKSDAELDRFAAATINYRDRIEHGQEDRTYVPMWETWVNGRWEDFEPLTAQENPPADDPFASLRDE